jgi:hypothetical protein
MPVSKDYVADYGADNTDTSDNCPELATFGTFAKLQGTDPVTLTIPAGTFKHDATAGSGGAAQFFLKGVTFATVQGAGKVGGPTGTTFRIPQTNSWSPPFFGGEGQHFGTSWVAKKIATVAAGSTSIFTVTAADAALYPVGRWVQITGIDLQGVIDGNYGFPTNAQFFDYAKVVSNDSGTGEIALDRALSDSYKSTWALQYDGVVGSGNPQGGPGYVYLMHSSFEQTTVVDGIYFDIPNASTPFVYVANNKSMTVQNCTFTGTSGPCPSQNVDTTWSNCDLTNAVIEVDKLVNNWTVDSCTQTTGKFFFQSSSTKNFTITNSTLNWLAGTPRNTTVTNSTINKFWFGQGYGMARRASISNSVISEFLTPTNSSYLVHCSPMSSGVIRIRRAMVVSGMSTSPGGKVRLTVDSTTDVGSVGVVAQTWNYDGLFTNLQGQSAITVVDATTVDLHTVDAATGASGNPVVWSGSGSLKNAAQSWAIPGYYCNMNSSTTGVGVVGNFLVTDQWNDNDYIYVQTNLAGTWPSNVSTFGQHPCREFYGTSNTGCPEIIEHSASAAYGKPVNSYIYREYDNTLATSGVARPTAWGAITSIKVNVVTAYTGGSHTQLRFRLSGSNNWQVTKSDLSVYSLDLRIDTKQVGLRTITPSGNTGGFAGDTLPTLSVGDRFGGNSLSAPGYFNQTNSPANVTSDAAGPFVTLEITTDQGIVNAPAAVVPLRLRLRAA